MKGKKMNEEPQSTLLRSVRVLFGLVEGGQPMTVTRLASVLNLPASTTHRILNVLRQGGYVAQNEETGSYGPGMAFLRATTMMAASSAFPATVNATLRDLVDRSGESAFYGAYLNEARRVRFAVTLHSHHAIQYLMRKDQTHSLLWGASGHSIASRLPEQTLRAIYQREKDSGEGVVILPRWDEMWRNMRQIRQDGYAISEGERHDGSHAIAAPVLGTNDAVIGCVGIAMPSARRDAKKTTKCVEFVTIVARQLSLTAKSTNQQDEYNTIL